MFHPCTSSVPLDAAGWPLVPGVALTIVLAFFIRETGSAARQQQNAT